MSRNATYFTPFILFFFVTFAQAQQQSDSSFQFAIALPAFNLDQGPSVCIDQAHFNYHTAVGRYKPYADLLRQDGFRIVTFSSSFNAQTLANCQVLIIANALAESNQADWSYPHPSAFTRMEIRALVNWVRNGGKLLLIADHAPFAGAAADLGAALGLVMVDVYAVQRRNGADVFRRNDNTLKEHAISTGRSSDEAISSVTTFTGQAVRLTGDWQPLLSFAAEAFAYISPQQVFQPQSNQVQGFTVNGWSQAATREWEQGKVVLLGEAAMCSAQISSNGVAMGMNSPQAPQNAQFCLNIMHWLTGVIN